MQNDFLEIGKLSCFFVFFLLKYKEKNNFILLHLANLEIS